MRIFKKINSLAHNKGLIFYTIIIVTALLIIWIFNNLVNIKKQEIMSVLENQADNIEKTFQSKIDDTYAIAKSINNQIISNPNDKTYIYNVLKNFESTPQLNQTFSWTVFSWMDKNDKIIINTVDGIAKDYHNDLSQRDYVQFVKNSSKVKIGLPTTGAVSNKFVIPGGIGSFDASGEYLGAVVFGLEIDILAKILYGALSNYNIRLDIIDSEGNYVLTANNCTLGHDEKSSIDKILSKASNEYDGKMQTVVDIGFFGNARAIYVKKIKGAPYFIALKYNQTALKNEIRRYILSKSLEILIILIISTFLLFIIYKRESLNSRKVRILKNVAESSNKAKTEFMIQTAHEFRNFLFGIQGAAEVVKNDLQLYKKGKLTENYVKQDIELTAEIIQTTRELLTFVNDMIDLNQAETGEFRIDKTYESVDLEKIITQAIKLLFSKALENKIKFDVKIKKDLHHLSDLDPRRIKQILINLISNAIKYSPNGSVIEIFANNIEEDRKIRKINNVTKSIKSRRVEIIIKDHGYGMSESEIDIIFKKDKIFNGSNGEVNSLGLGMPIVKYLVEKQDGILEIKSEKNKGTTVTVIL